MLNHETMNEKFEKFTWTINNFSKLETEAEYFIVGCYTWRIIVYIDEDLVGICLNFVDYSLDLIQGHSITVNFKLSLVNQRINTLTKSIDGQVRFNRDADDAAYIFIWKMSSAQIKSLILDDTFIIVAEFSINEESSHHQNQLDHGAGRTTVVDSLLKSCFHDYEDLVKNTKEKGFIQLVEEACQKHPSLIECHKNNDHSSMFTKCGFMALGRVLHFLKTKKVKDMNDEACKELQVLWKEVKAFGFDDLAWLEPRVKCAFGMSNYKEKAMHVKKMKENVAALEVDLKVARQELVKAEEGFEERDLNDVLGY
ncbi:hypothetical protein S83_040212 [Arachis hypogaea]